MPLHYEEESDGAHNMSELFPDQVGLSDELGDTQRLLRASWDAQSLIQSVTAEM